VNLEKGYLLMDKGFWIFNILKDETQIKSC
jgi:hypothetical protein